MIAMHLVEFTCQANTRTALMSVCCGLLCRLSLSPPPPLSTHTHTLTQCSSLHEPACAQCCHPGGYCTHSRPTVPDGGSGESESERVRAECLAFGGGIDGWLLLYTNCRRR